jgi:anti-sigma regulatory factor (Ser/Thr protein kinase)
MRAVTLPAMSGGASTVRAAAGGVTGLPEPDDSGARPAFHSPGKPARAQLWSFLELGALAGAVPCARLHARQVLWEWGLADLAETAELVVSEIVTNAVRASNGPDGRPRADAPVIRVWLSTDDRQHVLIQVWDASQRAPEQQHAGADSEHGRGLLLVDALSARWGAYRSAGNGKVVWAMVKL